MTFIGHKINESVNDGKEAVNDGVGPYIFKLHGKLSHKIGSLHLPDGKPPMYAQLYIYDPADAINFQMANVQNTHFHHPTLVTLLQDMLHHHHPAV